MIIIGVDPGKVTGIAFWRSEGSWSLQFGGSWSLTEVPAIVVTQTIKMMLRGQKPDIIACERFIQGTGRRPMTNQDDATWLAGELRELCRQLDCQFALQLAGSAKKIGPKWRLKQIGAFLQTPDNHANDAAAHVLRALSIEDPERFAALVGI